MLLINSLPSYLTRGHSFEPGTSLTDDIHPSIIVLQYSISVFTGDYAKAYNTTRSVLAALPSVVAMETD